MAALAQAGVYHLGWIMGLELLSVVAMAAIIAGLVQHRGWTFASFLVWRFFGISLLHTDVDWVYGLFGLGLFLVGLGYLLAPGYRRFLNQPHAEAEGTCARDYPALFS